jgi:hypothetical protein
VATAPAAEVRGAPALPEGMRFAYNFPSRRRLDAALTRQGHNAFTHAELPDGEGRPQKNNGSSKNSLSRHNKASSIPCWNKTIFRRSHPPKSVTRRSYCNILFRNEGMRLIIAGKEGNRGNPE